MELRQLRYFVAIADCGSLSKASERLHVAQPALSLQLASLEAECGSKLVDRHARGVSLTPSGVVLRRHAETLLRNVNDAVEAVRSRSEIVEGEVALGVPSTVTDTFIGRLIVRVLADYPQIRVRIVENTSGILADLLAEGTLDICILMNVADGYAKNTLPLLTESYCLASPPGERSPDATIRWSDVLSLPLLLPGTGSLLRQMLDDAARQAGIRLACVAEFDSARLLKAAARAGAGHTILPRSTLVDDPPACRLAIRTIVQPEITAVLQVCLSTNRPATRAQLAIREVLTEVVGDVLSDAGPAGPSSRLLTQATSSGADTRCR